MSLALKQPAAPEAAAFAALARAYEGLASMALQAARETAVQQTERSGARLEAEEAWPWSDGACQSECDRRYPDNWRLRWACKLFCP